MGTVPPDADGCCLTCGADAIGPAVDAVLASLAGHPADIPWRREPPTVEQVTAHATRLWIERDVATGTLAIVRFQEPHHRHAALDCDQRRVVLRRGGREWRPVDRDGVPVPWPVLEGGDRG